MRFGIFSQRSISGPILCGLALLCISSFCPAQRYTFRAYNEGLNNLNVISIAQDHTGYLWVGTQNGLYRYDGIKFLRYGPNDGLPAREIQKLYVGLDGTLWVGTTTGIYFQQRDGSFSEIQAPAPAGQFSQRIGTTFTAKTPDQVVAATRNGAFLLRRVATDHWIAEPMNLASSQVSSVLYGPDGALWYGCDSDLCRLADGRTTRMGAALGLPQDQWLHLLADRNGRIWIRGLMHVGEVLPAEGRFELHDLPGKSNAEPFQTLAEDARGHIVAAQGPAFGTWEDGHWLMVTEHNGLEHLDISALFTDREGSFWIGVVGHGLMMWLGKGQWQAYTAADGLSNDTVWATARDHQGRLWIGTDSGLDFIPAGGGDPRTWKAPDGQTNPTVALAVSADGAIWMGSADGSVTRIDPNTLAGTRWKTPAVNLILADRENRIWVATEGGLYVADPAARTKSPQLVEDAAFANPRQRFASLCLDPSGRVWAAGDLGLFRLDGKSWSIIDLRESGAKPNTIAVDRQGYLWTAGPSQNLMRMRVSGDRVVEAKQFGTPPLLSDQVVALVADDRGWVWVGQDAGVSVYDGHDWRSFTQDDGLIWNDIDGSALMEDADGSMWIGTSGGLSHLLQPRAAPAGLQAAPVFSRVLYNDAPLSNGAKAKWGDGSLVISMASLSFRDTRDIGIRYRLQGAPGAGWEETREMTVRYRRLEPGDYRFEAVLVDAAGSALSPTAVFTFRILPYWWQNMITQFAFALLGIFLALAAWRWRVDRLTGQKQELESAVRTRTEDLEREKAELFRTREQMRHNAEHDGLTGLWNHRIIMDRLRGEVERSRRDGTPVSVILADLDHFKKINDTFGHTAGDMVLKEISAILQNLVRSYDWAGRYGGEEFLLVLPGASLEGARLRAEQMRKAIEDAGPISGGKTIQTTASFGVVSGFPSDYEAMIQSADEALYRAKNSGRNCVVTTDLTRPKLAAADRQNA
ncbi:MAG: diguanylate cyclase [Terracidiphilus sp.]